MKVVVNGEEREYEESITLSSLIDDLGIKVSVMAGAVNMEIVKRDDWGSYKLVDGDKVELLHFVGGG
jgi:sulfur carrier protein